MLVIINNDGGGIFSFLPVHQNNSVFDKYWGTPHGLNFQSFAQGFGIKYRRIHTQKDLRDSLENFSESVVLEVQTNREENFKLHQSIVERLKRDLL